MMPAEILMRTDIGPGPKLLCAQLHDYARESGNAYPGLRHLQEALGITSRGTLQRWIDVLVCKDLIAVVAGTGRRANAYSVPVLSTLQPSCSVPQTENLCPVNEKLASRKQVPTILDHTIPDQRDGLGETGTQAEAEGGNAVDAVEQALESAGVSAPSVRLELIGRGVTVGQISEAYAGTVGALNRGGATVAKLRETFSKLNAATASSEAKEGREARERAERATERAAAEAEAADRERAREYLEPVAAERTGSAWEIYLAENPRLRETRATPAMFPVAVADRVDPAWRDSGSVPG